VLHRLSEIEPDNWLDFKSELNKIYIELQKLEIRGITRNQLLTQRVDEYSLTVKTNVIYTLLGSKLNNDTARLRQLKQQGLLDTPEQIELVDDLIEAITTDDAKKKDFGDMALVTARLHGSFPQISIDQITNRLRALKELNNDGILAIVEEYAKLVNGIKESEFETGTSQGEEIHTRILDDVKALLPAYPLEKLLYFRLVLSDVINYFITSMRAGKKTFPFLFRNDAVEKDLQNSMMQYFSISNRASSYIPEVTEAADGGRVDILYKGVSFQFPIELKRSQDVLSWEKIEQNYISQAQTYAYTRDQLAFFLVLDISPQEPQKPPANVKDLFRVIHLRAKHDLDSRFPDYVVCFIVPGNKVHPHERSKY
jgi:hypothetical protein